MFAGEKEGEMKGGKREEAWTCSWFLKTQTKQKKNTRITANPQKEQQTNSAGAEKQEWKTTVGAVEKKNRTSQVTSHRADCG